MRATLRLLAQNAVGNKSQRSKLEHSRLSATPLPVPVALTAYQLVSYLLAPLSTVFYYRRDSRLTLKGGWSEYATGELIAPPPPSLLLRYRQACTEIAQERPTSTKISTTRTTEPRINGVQAISQTVVQVAAAPRIRKRKTSTSSTITTLDKPIIDGSRPKLIWFHGASLGETLSLLGLVQRALDHHDSSTHVLLTFTSSSAPAGLQHHPLIQQRQAIGRLHLRYAPYDFISHAQEFLDSWQPDAAVFAESELWPNLICSARDRSIPLALVNARLSKKSERRWRWFARSLFTHLLSCFELILCQSPTDLHRIMRLCPAIENAKQSERVGYLGDLKELNALDSLAGSQSAPARVQELNRIRKHLGLVDLRAEEMHNAPGILSEDCNMRDTDSKMHNITAILSGAAPYGPDNSTADVLVKEITHHDSILPKQNARMSWMAISTHDGEEEVLIRSHHVLVTQHNFSGAILLIAPRYPNKGVPAVLAACAEYWPDARVTLNSSASDEEARRAHIYVLDSVGEASKWLAATRGVAFVGGSLTASKQTAQHNLWEPVAAGCLAVMHGPRRRGCAGIVKEEQQQQEHMGLLNGVGSNVIGARHNTIVVDSAEAIATEVANVYSNAMQSDVGNGCIKTHLQPGFFGREQGLDRVWNTLLQALQLTPATCATKH